MYLSSYVNRYVSSFSDVIQLLIITRCKPIIAIRYCLDHSITVRLAMYSKTSLSGPTMGLTLNGPFREMVGLGS